jgi:hypothetical protein
VTIFSRLFASQVITLAGEEARTAIGALRRSAEAMPDPSETIRSREMRAKREVRLADAIGNRIEGGI